MDDDIMEMVRTSQQLKKEGVPSKKNKAPSSFTDEPRAAATDKKKKKNKSTQKEENDALRDIYDIVFKINNESNDAGSRTLVDTSVSKVEDITNESIIIESNQSDDEDSIVEEEEPYVDEDDEEARSAGSSVDAGPQDLEEMAGNDEELDSDGEVEKPWYREEELDSDGDVEKPWYREEELYGDGDVEKPSHTTEEQAPFKAKGNGYVEKSEDVDKYVENEVEETFRGFCCCCRPAQRR
jgi:hypothetical protein